MVRAFAFATLVALTACRGKGTGDTGDESPPVDTTVAFSAKSVSGGGTIDLADFKGQVVLLNIWATWCRPCKRELPELERLHEEYKSQGFSVVGISVDKPQKVGSVHQMIKGVPLTYPMAFDPDGESLKVFNVNAYPTSILIGRDGLAVWRRNGAIANNDRDLATNLKAALDRPTPPPS